MCTVVGICLNINSFVQAYSVCKTSYHKKYIVLFYRICSKAYLFIVNYLFSPKNIFHSWNWHEHQYTTSLSAVYQIQVCFLVWITHEFLWCPLAFYMFWIYLPRWGRTQSVCGWVHFCGKVSIPCCWWSSFGPDVRFPSFNLFEIEFVRQRPDPVCYMTLFIHNFSHVWVWSACFQPRSKFDISQGSSGDILDPLQPQCDDWRSRCERYHM